MMKTKHEQRGNEKVRIYGPMQIMRMVIVREFIMFYGFNQLHYNSNIE